MTVDTPLNTELFEQVAQLFPTLPHCVQLGLRFIERDGVKPVIAVDWRDDLVGNPSTGVVHGGVITSLVDTCSALSVIPYLKEIEESFATLDLRIDYACAARPGSTIFCRAECYRLTPSIAFTRAICYHEGEEYEPIAHGVATFFMKGSPMRSPKHLNSP